MADSENILVTADSAGAVTAFNNLSGAVSGLDTTMESLGNTFSKPLEHVGVHLFGTELLQTVGIAGAGRPIIMLLQTAVTELGTTFGFAGGEVGLVVMGLAAAAAVIYKVVEAHKAHAESIQTLVDANKKQYDSTVEAVDSLEKYRSAVGELPPVLKALEDAEKSKMAVTRSSTIETENEQIATLQKTKAANLDLIASTNASIAEMKQNSLGYMALAAAAMGVTAQIEKMTAANETARKENITTSAQIKSVTADVAAQTKGFKDWEDQVSHGTASATEYTKGIENIGKEVEILNGLQKKYTDDDLAATNTVWQSKTAKIQSELDKETTAIQAHFKKGSEALKAAESEEIAGATATGEKVSAIKAKYAALGQNLEIAAIEAVEAADKLAQDKRAELNKLQVDNFQSTMSTISELASSKNSELKAIGKAAALADAYMNTYAAADKALASAPPPFSYALAAATITVGLENVSKILAAEGGADMDVSSPTLFLAGERGTEHVEITPASQNGGGSAGGGNTYYIGPFVAQGNDNPTDFAKKVLAYILQETRGRGQVTVKSASIW